MAEHIQRDWWCLDLGAHVGWYTMLMSLAARDGQVLAVDACGRSLGMLGENLAYNSLAQGFDFGNVTTIEIAVGSRAGEHEETLWLTGLAPDEGKTEGRFLFTTIDALVRDWPRVDLIKIDLDGWDYDALLGGLGTLRERRPILVAEINHALAWRGRTPVEVERFLDRMAYDHDVLDAGNPNNWLLTPRWRVPS